MRAIAILASIMLGAAAGGGTAAPPAATAATAATSAPTTVATSAPTQDPVAAFYAGKTVKIIVGYPPPGAYDGYARTLAAHIGR